MTEVLGFKCFENLICCLSIPWDRHYQGSDYRNRYFFPLHFE